MAKSIALVALSFMLLVATGARAQVVAIGDDSQLRSVEFEFPQTQSFDTSQLEAVLQHPRLGRMAGLRRKLQWLPFIDPPIEDPFDPIELQRDVVRLREFYRRSGFTGTKIDYDVEHDTEDDVLDIRFRITEGKPFGLHSVVIADPAGAAPETWLPNALRDDWLRFAGDAIKPAGTRFGEAEAEEHTRAVKTWFADHGYPWADVQSEVAYDDSALTADQRITVASGQRARIGRVNVEGNTRVAPTVVARSMLVSPGEFYSAADLRDGQRLLLNTQLFRLVVVDVPEQPHDATVDIRVRVEENAPRLIVGELGYLTDSGVMARADWTHRNFFGNARTLTLTGIGQTGVWALEDDPARLARLAVSWTRPGLFSPRVSVVTTPFGEYRDDQRDRSWGYGNSLALAYVGRNWLRNAAAAYEIDRRDILEVRAGAASTDFLSELRAQVTDFDHTTNSRVTLAAGIGVLDEGINPRRVFLVRPSVELTVPSAWNTASYVRSDLGISATRPIGRTMAWSARVSGGRMFPYGKSEPVSVEIDGLRKFLELRDRAFTAGGSSDVRGWPTRLLGPKFPDIDTANPDTTRLRADRYIPIGGLARISASAELRLPFPGLSERWGTHVFVDGGRVWNPDRRFLGSGDEFGQEKFFWATGFGVDRDTPVGPLRLSVARMLNPSRLDLLRAQEFLDADRIGAVDSQPVHWQRYLRFHVSIGTGF
jgi:outer membrane protein insertion porin family